MNTRKLLPVFGAIEHRAIPLSMPIDHDKAPFFEVHSLEWLETHREISNNVRRVKHFEIVWLSRGTGRFRIDTSSYPITDNTLYLVHPGRVLQLEATGQIKGSLISFSSDFLYLSTECPGSYFFRDVIKAFSEGQVLKLQDTEIEVALTNLLAEMMREFGCYKSLRMEILAGLLKVCLIYLHRMSGKLHYITGASKKVDLYNRFQVMVEKHFLAKKQVADYASDLSVTPSYLTEVIKIVSGFSASHHIQQRMLLEAKRLALYSSANMKEIAYQLGFDDISHFSKYFKNVAGVTFSQFRQNNLLQLGAAYSY